MRCGNLTGYRGPDGRWLCLVCLFNERTRIRVENEDHRECPDGWHGYCENIVRDPSRLEGAGQ